jgi:predicted nicotinamide N-methyase
MPDAVRLHEAAASKALEPWLLAMVDFIEQNTERTRMPLLPEIELRLAADSVVLWDKIAQRFSNPRIGAPYWAFAWAAGQALARYILDNPHLVAGRRVLDVASGSGLVAIAAAMAGAKHVIANDVDLLSVVALSLNAGDNNSQIEASAANLIAHDSVFDPASIDVLLLGDVFYDPDLGKGAGTLMQRCQAAGCLVLSGDPGRAHLPARLLQKVAEYEVPVTRDCQYTSSAPIASGHDIFIGTIWTPNAHMSSISHEQDMR